MHIPFIYTDDPCPSSSEHTSSTTEQPPNFKQITFTVTSVSPSSPVRYHIEEHELTVHVFLNCPLSRLDLDTIREILRKAEKPCRPLKAPASAPPSPHFPTTVSSNHHPKSPISPIKTSNLKSRNSLLAPYTTTCQRDASSPIHTSHPQKHHRNNGPHNGGKSRQIHFYDKDKPYYGFTNFSGHPVKYKGQMYPTSEHLFQSLKFMDHQPFIAELIRLAARPRDAFDLAHQHRKFVRDNWYDVNIKIMDDVLRQKFTQHEDLKRELLATGDAELIEASDYDSFWGWGANHKGRNELGKALMRLRTRLR